MTLSEILALRLPVADHRVSVTPTGIRTACAYRYATEEHRDGHLRTEQGVLMEGRGR